MLEVLSKRIAAALKRNSPSEIDIEVLEYGIAMKLNLVGTFFITGIAGLLLNQFLESMFALLVLCLIRRFSGGVHFSSLTMCMLTTSLFCTITPMISLNSRLTFALTILSLIIFLARAPNWFEDVKSIDKGTYKLISTMIVCSNLIIQSDMLAMVFIVQGVTILPSSKGGVHHEKNNGKVFEQTN